MDLKASPTACAPEAVREQKDILGPWRLCTIALLHRLMFGSMVRGQRGFTVSFSSRASRKVYASLKVYCIPKAPKAIPMAEG
jgi:hypothetical protein